ncbi:MAG: tRNA adenosine(34) deaminase TadA [Legionellales bacterium]|nr:tRNA adenosine(34) deaminase TadA [Legionellales bacterium]
MGISDDERSTHEYWMQYALEQARLAQAHGEVPVGAVIVHDDELIASGFNQPIEQHDPTAHAEIIALRHAGRVLKNYRLTNCLLYVTIEPCAMCMGAIIHARLSQLIVGASDLKSGACGSALSVMNHPKLNHQVQFTQGILAKECQSMIQNFFRARR